MGRKKSNIIELFIDKALMTAAIIAALVILLFFVIGNPSGVEYDGEKYSPGKIDEAINKKAADIQDKLKQEPQDTNSYQPKVSFYAGLIKNNLQGINTNINFPLPGYPSGPGEQDRKYELPTIEQAKKPFAAVVTMAAYVPTDEISDAAGYDKAETRLADMDLVTIESSINAKQLYENFKSAFAGRSIRSEWRDEQYAKPVFAKVELQRRTLLADGSWSQWEEVPKTKLCPFKKKFQIQEQTNDNDYTQIALEQFSDPKIRDEILQPPVYDNAIPAETWLCPSLYNERQKRLEKEQEELKRQQLEEEKAKKLQEKAAPKRQPSAVRQPPKTATGKEGRETTPQSPTQPRQLPKPKPTAPSPAAGSGESKQTLTELQKFSEILLSDKTNPANMEKLVFWAHDDTTKPGEKYQYRIRIGVFNPIAGKPCFTEEQKDLQNQTVLMSNFSDPTETIEIPSKLYFFATDVRENDKTVEVEVARFTLGNWVLKKFSVKAGEEIGTAIDAAGTSLEKAGVNIDSIDLATGNIMVDVRWASVLIAGGRPGNFPELLYCKPGQAIETMPIRTRFWPEEVTKVHKEIEEALPVILLPRAQSGSGIRTTETK